MLIKQRLTKFQKKARNRTGLAVVAAFALVIGLSWNEAIKALVNDILIKLEVTGTTFYYKIIAAILTTIICVAGIMYFSRWSEAEKK